MTRSSNRPILVTGMPRSGTTWLARLLATAPRTALTGREPMNPRGRQYALGGTLSGWAELDSLTPRQRRALTLCYRGLNPFAFGRYGRRQWAAPLPAVRVIIKDPFAMLSIRAVAQATGSAVVLLYRHPGASLASYRRMGWRPDLDELDPILAAHRRRHGMGGPENELRAAKSGSEAEAMGRFWSALYEMALDNATGLPELTVVSHEELAGQGPQAAHQLFDTLRLRWSAASDAEFAEQGGEPAAAVDSQVLHNLGRPPAAVAASWRARLEPGEVDVIEAVTERLRRRLYDARLVLSTGPTRP